MGGQERERSPSQFGVTRPRNPYTRDPILDSKEDVARLLESCDTVTIDWEPNQPMKNVCTCGQCSEKITLIKTKNGVYEHLCCRQLQKWVDQFSEADCMCVTDSDAYNAVTNYFAVKNLLLVTWHSKKEEMLNWGQTLCDPPSNKNMRFGNYKGSFVFVQDNENI